MAVIPLKIIPTLQNCSITAPAKSSDGRYYLDPSHMTVTLKADTGYIFESDGTLTYQNSDDLIPLPIKATKTDTATVTLPSDISWDDNYTFPLKMSAVKATTVTTPTPTALPATKPTTAPTQLDTLKNSLRIPSDLTDDDMLLNGYLNSAKAYILNACDSDADKTSIVIDPRFQIAQIEIATLMYENRGSDKAANGFPYTLQVLINQLRFT